MQGFTFRSGSGSTGGAIHVAFGNGQVSHLEVVDCVFDSNAITSGGGGAISVSSGGDAQIRGCTFTNNSGAGGAAIEVIGTPSSTAAARIEGCRFSGNRPTVSGGSVSVQ